MTLNCIIRITLTFSYRFTNFNTLSIVPPPHSSLSFFSIFPSHHSSLSSIHPTPPHPPTTNSFEYLQDLKTLQAAIARIEEACRPGCSAGTLHIATLQLQVLTLLCSRRYSCFLHSYKLLFPFLMHTLILVALTHIYYPSFPSLLWQKHLFPHLYPPLIFYALFFYPPTGTYRDHRFGRTRKRTNQTQEILYPHGPARRKNLI